MNRWQMSAFCVNNFEPVPALGNIDALRIESGDGMIIKGRSLDASHPLIIWIQGNHQDKLVYYWKFESEDEMKYSTLRLNLMRFFRVIIMRCSSLSMMMIPIKYLRI